MIFELAGSTARYWVFVEWLSSATALRVYALLVGAAALAFSLRQAISANTRLASQFEDTSRLVRLARRGRPTTAEGWARRRERIRALYREGLRNAAGLLVRSFSFGVVAPATALLFATLNYGWFQPAAEHLLSAGEPVRRVPAPDAAMFVLDQTLRGGLFDLLEVFALQTTPIDNNPASWAYSSGLFLYHLYVEAFVFSGALLFVQSAWRLRRTSEAEMDRLQQSRTQEQAQPAAQSSTTL